MSFWFCLFNSGLLLREAGKITGQLQAFNLKYLVEALSTRGIRLMPAPFPLQIRYDYKRALNSVLSFLADLAKVETQWLVLF